MRLSASGFTPEQWLGDMHPAETEIIIIIASSLPRGGLEKILTKLVLGQLMDESF